MWSNLWVSGDLLDNFCIRAGSSFNPSTQETFDPTTFQVCHCQQSAVAQGETTMFQCEEIVVERYVTIHFPHNKTAALHVCEVQVFGTSESKTLCSSCPVPTLALDNGLLLT